MKRARVVLLLALALVVVGSCESDDNRGPTQPAPPTPSVRANLTPYGNYRWQDCVSSLTPSCTFVAALRNTGNGCAVRVEGTIRFFNVAGFQVGGTSTFVLPTQQVVGVGEVVPYFVPFVPVFAAQTATDYTVTPVWIDTPCH